MRKNVIFNEIFTCQSCMFLFKPMGTPSAITNTCNRESQFNWWILRLCLGAELVDSLPVLRGCSLGISTGMSLSFFSLSSTYHLLILVCSAGFRNNRSQISRSHPVAGSSRSLAGTGNPLYDDSIITQFW